MPASLCPECQAPTEWSKVDTHVLACHFLIERQLACTLCGWGGQCALFASDTAKQSMRLATADEIVRSKLID